MKQDTEWIRVNAMIFNLKCNYSDSTLFLALASIKYSGPLYINKKTNTRNRYSCIHNS